MPYRPRTRPSIGRLAETSARGRLPGSRRTARPRPIGCGYCGRRTPPTGQQGRPALGSNRPPGPVLVRTLSATTRRRTSALLRRRLRCRVLSPAASLSQCPVLEAGLDRSCGHGGETSSVERAVEVLSREVLDEA